MSTDLRNIIALHVVNHITKARDLVKRHETRIRHARLQRKQRHIDAKVAESLKEDQQDAAVEEEEKEEEKEYRDQGFTRPRVLVLLPFRSNAEAFVNAMLPLLPRDVNGKGRFVNEYGPSGT